MIGNYRYIQTDADGKILLAVSGNPDRFTTEPVIDLGSDEYFDPLNCYYSGGTVVGIPGKPTPRSVFDYYTKQWIEPPYSDYEVEMAWVSLRVERSRLLQDSDWTQVPDAPVDRAAWAVYRQALRDVPQNTTDPFNPVWPTPPA